MTAACPPSAALAAGSELAFSNRAIKIDVVLLGRSLGHRVLLGGGRAGQRTTSASFSLPSFHCQPTGDE